jgi:histone arginine demethylase JMJD6
LDEWEKHNYYERFPKLIENEVAWLESIDALTNNQPHPQASSDLSHIDYDSDTIPDRFNVNDLPHTKKHLATVQSIPRIHTDKLSVADFRSQFEIPNKPVIIEGLTSSWPSHGWTFESLLHSKYAHAKFRVGDDDNGRAIRIPLKNYIHYARNTHDDSPLYLFEDAFDEDDVAKGFLNDYTPPEYFNEDIFKLLPFDRRPPFRWILVGPAMSGTRMHIDPLDSSAWNVVLSGRKRWVLMSPQLSHDLALGKHVWTAEERKDGRSPQAIYWFQEVLPRIRAYVQATGRDYELKEFIQYPGDVLFVPSLWHHAVMNLDETVSFTQNWVSNTNFPAAWRAMRSRRNHMARRLLLRLQIFYPHLAKVANDVDNEDNYAWSTTKFTSKTKDMSLSSRMKLRQTALRVCKELDSQRFGDIIMIDENEEVEKVLDVMMSGDTDSSDDSDDSDCD